MTRKGAVLVAGIGAIALTMIFIAFQLRSGTALPGVAPESSGSPDVEPQPLQLLSPALFTVGILREDAILIPFASFDGASWFNRWPDLESPVPVIPQRLTEIPPEWWGGPPALHWRLLAFDGGRQAITTTGIREFQTHCTPNVGLTTNFQSRVEAERLHHYAGVAATVDNLLTPVAKLEKDDRDFEAIRRLLPQLFARLEPGVWESRAGTEYEPLLTGSLPAPTLNYVHKGTSPDGSELFTFNALRELPRGALNGQSLEMVTRVVGWFTRVGTASLVLLDARGSQSDLDGKGGDDSFIPFAALTVAGRSFWLGNSSGYESEVYVVVEVGRGIPMVQMTAAAGGC